MSFYDFENLAEVLSYELEIRSNKNKRFSKRSFAAQLDISPSQLIMILKKQKGLSEVKARSVAIRLGYHSQRIEWFVLLVLKDFARGKLDRQLASIKIKKYEGKLKFKKKNVNEIGFTPHWYHYAIRVMSDLDGFEFDANWISKKLDVDITLIKSAMRDLIKNDLLIKNYEGKYEKRNKMLFFSEGADAKNIMDSSYNELMEVVSNKIKKNNQTMVYDISKFFTINSNKIQTLINFITTLDTNIDDLNFENPNHDGLICLKIRAFRLDDFEPD
jgi:uncharacterized protein (TIGR02147 family)